MTRDRKQSPMRHHLYGTYPTAQFLMSTPTQIRLTQQIARLLTAVFFFSLLGMSDDARGQTTAPALLNPAAVQGKLAFVVRGSLYVLDGAPGVLRSVAHPGFASRPKWSSDGHWLAYASSMAVRNAYGAPPVLVETRIVRADGSANHSAYPGFVDDFVWSPVADRLALAINDGPRSGLWVTTPASPPHEIVADRNFRAPSIVWSPDGERLAYRILLPSGDATEDGDALYTVSGEGGSPVLRVVKKPGAIVVDSWWPDGNGLLFWSLPTHSASIAAYGLALESLRLSGERRARTLVTSGFELTWSPDKRQFLVVRGHSRNPAHDRALVLCDLTTEACRPVSQPARTVALDPAWSPRGRDIAFQSALDVGGEGGLFATAQEAEAWARTTRIMVEGIGGVGGRPIVVDTPFLRQGPLWSRDGKRILYVDEEGIWLLDSDTGVKHQVIRGPVDAGSVAWYR